MSKLFGVFSYLLISWVGYRPLSFAWISSKLVRSSDQLIQLKFLAFLFYRSVGGVKAVALVMDKSSVEGIYEWIDEIGDKIPFSRAKKNFARDFSDGVLVAELLKYFYPRIVELHNYPAANSYALKIENWNTMNRKVLSKLKLHLSNHIIEELSRANPRAVERLLIEIRQKIQTTCNVENKESEEVLNSEFIDEIVKIPINTGDEGEKVYKKMIPASLLEKKVAEVKEKDKTIALLEKKIQHLESLLSLKETRIHDLTTQLYKPERNELPFKSVRRSSQLHTSL